jgi:peptidoglycan hydrolase-like protein with peptidoglycan-binding domain
MNVKPIAIACAAALISTGAIAGGGAMQNQSQAPETVKQAQEKLNVQADGKLGPQTQAALKDVQEKQGLQPSGQLDTQTVAALGIGEQQSSTGGSSPAPSTSDAPSSSAPEAPAPSEPQPADSAK